MLNSYKGNLGSFTYDTEQFRIVTYKEYKQNYTKKRVAVVVDYLEYIGNETDGKKINIPDGVNNCKRLFFNKDLRTMPIIPSSVKITSEMFYYCQYLEEVDYLPPYIEQADSMFYGCFNLIKVAPLPTKLKNAEGMFKKCSNLTEVYGSLPLHLTNAKSMFQECYNLMYAPKIDIHKNAFIAVEMYSECRNLKNAYDFYWLYLNSLHHCISRMYAGCNKVRFNTYYKTKTLVNAVPQSNLLRDICAEECCIDNIVPLQIDITGLESQFQKILETKVKRKNNAIEKKVK